MTKNKNQGPQTQNKVTALDYKSPNIPTWCPGCGNFIINSMLAQALAELNLAPHQVALVYDIGCNGNGADKIRGQVVKSLHGRPIPVALGIKLARPELKVIANGGDGGLLWEGVSHLIAAAHRDYPITVLIWDNQIYGLTTGQSSPTTQTGFKTPTYPQGTPYTPIEPVSLMLASKARFVARTYTGDPIHLKETIKQAISFDGFAVVDIRQNCASYNPTNEYYKNRVEKLKEPFKDTAKAIEYAQSQEPVYMGTFRATAQR